MDNQIKEISKWLYNKIIKEVIYSEPQKNFETNLLIKDFDVKIQAKLYTKINENIFTTKLGIEFIITDVLSEIQSLVKYDWYVESESSVCIKNYKKFDFEEFKENGTKHIYNCLTDILEIHNSFKLNERNLPF